MAKFDTSSKPKPPVQLSVSKVAMLWSGIGFIVLAVLVLCLSLYEGILGGGNIRTITLPGFHELKMDAAGLYAGIYQHRSRGPMPVKQLTQMDVRLMSKEGYEEVPVVMNTSGQTFDQMGIKALPLFNFMLPESGTYTLSGVYTGEVSGPTVPVLLIPQSAGNIKQTLVVGGGFFVLFLTMGILILLKRRPRSTEPPLKKK